jgi:hypothetical protein
MESLLTKTAAWLGCCLFVFYPVTFSPVAHAESTWFRQYQSIDDPETLEFAWNGFQYAQALLGAPRISVTTVHLCLSVPVKPKSSLKKHFQLTETTDADKGIFTIYVSREPGAYAFAGQLAHEICHLLNGNLHDAYTEGICTVFAEKYLVAQGYDWSGWRRYFDQGNAPFYGATYYMMREIWNLVGNRQIGRLLTCARDFPDGSGKMYLDVTDWLRALPEQKQHNVVQVIERYKAVIERQIEVSESPVCFVVPSPELLEKDATLQPLALYPRFADDPGLKTPQYPVRTFFVPWEQIVSTYTMPVW